MKITWNLIAESKGAQVDKIGQYYGVKRESITIPLLFGWKLTKVENDKKYKNRIIDEIEFIRDSM